MILIKQALSQTKQEVGGWGRKNFFGGSDVKRHATVCKTNIYRVVSCQGEFTTCL